MSHFAFYFLKPETRLKNSIDKNFFLVHAFLTKMPSLSACAAYMKKFKANHHGKWWPVNKQNGLRAEWIQEQKNRKLSFFISLSLN